MRYFADFALTLLPFGMVYGGLWLVSGHGPALLGTGFLVWVDLQLPGRGQ